MIKYLKVGYRNITRHKRRTILTISLIGSVVAVAVFMEGFLEGSNDGWLRSVISSETGHIQIMPRGYRDVSVMSPLENLISSPEMIKGFIKDNQEVIGVTERLNFGGMIATEEKTVIFSGIGIDPVNEYEIFDLISASHGKKISPLDKEGCLIGSLLAKNLGLKVGDSAALITNTVEGAINAVNVKIVGIFESGVSQVDSMMLYIPITHAQKLTNAQGRVSHIILLLDDIQKVELYSKKLKGIIEKTNFRDSVEIWQWDELATLYKRVTNMERFQLLVVEGIMLFIIVLSITIIMLMSVFERVKEIGTLTAFGISQREIIFLFLTEASIIGVLGGFAGAVTGFIITKIGYFIGIPFNPPSTAMTVYIRPLIVFSKIYMVFIVAVFTTIIGGIYPAIWGSKIRPTEALRYV